MSHPPSRTCVRWTLSNPRPLLPAMGRYDPMEDVAAANDESKEILDAAEAAAVLRVSVKTLLRLAREGKLVGRKVGREWRFCHSDVLGFVRGGATDR